MSAPTRKRLVLATIKITHQLYVPPIVSKEAQVNRAMKLTAFGNPDQNFVLLHDHASTEPTCNEGCCAYPEGLDTDWIELVH